MDITLATNKQLEKIPPQNLEAEQAVLGSLLIDKDAIIKIMDIVTPEDFYKDKHKMIFEAITDLYTRHEPIDVVSLTNRLTERQQLDAVGGRSYLVSLANTVPTASNIENYAHIVQRKATLRRLLNAASEMINLGYQEVEDVDVVLDQAEQKLFTVSQKYLKHNFIPIGSVLNEAFDRIDEIHRDGNKMRGLKTGFTDLDNILSGLQKSDLVIIAARPSMGKTSLALDIARQTAMNGATVGLFSLEMSKEQLVDRLLCAQADVDLWKMRTGKLSDRDVDGTGMNDFQRIGDAMGKLSEAAIYIDDGGSNNIMEIRTKARRLKMEHGLDLLIVDYLQLLTGSIKTDNRVQEVSEISRSMKQLARELNVPLVALSQLSRAVESRNVQIPKLSDLRESGSIEQDSDVVVFIYREDYHKKDTDRPNIADIIIAKHRNGPVGQVELFFDQTKASFRNLARADHGFEPPPLGM